MWTLLFFLVITSFIFAQNNAENLEIYISGTVLITLPDSQNLHVYYHFPIEYVKNGEEIFFGGKCVSTEKFLFFNKGEEFFSFGRIVIVGVERIDSFLNYDTTHNFYHSFSFSFIAQARKIYSKECKNEYVFYFKEKISIGYIEGYLLFNVPPKNLFDILIPPSKKFKFINSLSLN